MTEKPNDPGKTHVLDDDEIEELDVLTLTSIVRDASELLDGSLSTRLGNWPGFSVPTRPSLPCGST